MGGALTLTPDARTGAPYPRWKLPLLFLLLLLLLLTSLMPSLVIQSLPGTGGIALSATDASLEIIAPVVTTSLSVTPAVRSCTSGSC